MKRFALFLVALTVLSVGVTLQAELADDTIGITYRLQGYDTIDPHISNTTQIWWINFLWTDTLVNQGPDGEFYPGLASEWEASDEGKTWVFTLREGVTFHDGTPWNADAMVDNIARVIDPETKSKGFASIFENLVSYEATGPMEVTLTFTRAEATLIQRLAASVAAWLSPTAFNNPANVEIQDRLVGTGPWMLMKEIRGQVIEFKANPDYAWGPEFYENQGTPAIENIVFSFIVEDETRLTALLTGETDFIVEVPATQKDALRADPGFWILEGPRPGAAQQLHFNVSKSPTDELAVRQACIYAVDQEAITYALFRGTYVPAYGLMMQASPYYPEEIESFYSYDPNKARQLLDEAGWIVGSDGIRERDGQKLILEAGGWPGLLCEGPLEMVQAFYAEVGIKMNINIATGGAFAETAADLNTPWHHASAGSSGIDTVERLYRFGHSESLGSSNYAHVNDPEYDRLVDICRTTTDDEARAAAASQAQIYWMENAFSNPLLSVTNQFGLSSRLVDVKLEIGGAPVFYDAKIDTTQ